MQVSEYLEASENKKKIKKKTKPKHFWEHTATDHRSKYFVLKALLTSTIPSALSPAPVLFVIRLLKEVDDIIFVTTISFYWNVYTLFFLLKGKILVWSLSCLLVHLFCFQRVNQCVSSLCVSPACHSFCFFSDNSIWQFQKEILQPKNKSH